MAWRRSGDKPLSEPMMVSLPTHICVTRPQWVKYLQTFGLRETWKPLANWMPLFTTRPTKPGSWIFCVRTFTTKNTLVIRTHWLCQWLIRRRMQWNLNHDDVIQWKQFPRYWPFVWGINRSPVNSPHKGQWRGTLMFSLICVWINGWVNNRKVGHLRRYRAHYDVIVMIGGYGCKWYSCSTNAGLLFRSIFSIFIILANKHPGVLTCQCWYIWPPVLYSQYGKLWRHMYLVHKRRKT